MKIFDEVESDIFVVDHENFPSLQLLRFCVLENDEQVPLLSGVILAEKLLEKNRTDQDMEIYRSKACEKVINWTFFKDYVLYKGRLVLSSKNNPRTKIIEDLHSRILTAHPGRNKTRKLSCKKFWWPGMNGDVDVYVKNYPCKSAKSPRDKTPGPLRPLPIPLRPWHHIIVDFKYMPKAKDGSDNTFNIIDKLTKETWSTTCKRTATAKDAAWMFYKGPYRVHGLPQTISSDRGPQFTADFTDEMCQILGIKCKLSTAGHSQSVRQVKNYHEYLDQRLRMFLNHYQDNWPEALPAMDASQASSPRDSLDGLTPFEVSHRYTMPLPFDWENRTGDVESLNSRKRITKKDAQNMAEALKKYTDVAREALKRVQ